MKINLNKHRQVKDSYYKPGENTKKRQNKKVKALNFVETLAEIAEETPNDGVFGERTRLMLKTWRKELET